MKSCWNHISAKVPGVKMHPVLPTISPSVRIAAARNVLKSGAILLKLSYCWKAITSMSRNYKVVVRGSGSRMIEVQHL